MLLEKLHVSGKNAHQRVPNPNVDAARRSPYMTAQISRCLVGVDVLDALKQLYNNHGVPGGSTSPRTRLFLSLSLSLPPYMRVYSNPNKKQVRLPNADAPHKSSTINCRSSVTGQSVLPQHGRSPTHVSIRPCEIKRLLGLYSP